MRLNNKQIGCLGEQLAHDYLMERGYTLVERNFRSKIGELDLVVMSPDRCMVIVEVKTDTSHRAGSPESWVTGKKMHQLAKVAQVYVALHARHISRFRYDVISVVLSDKKPLIRHFENAFLPVTGAY